MTKFVTFCATDGEVESNPMWHSCILLSETDADGKGLKVHETWGFYGLPSTANKDSWFRRLKIWYGLDVDWTGNHGMLRHEEVRYMDKGVGLHGVSFELTDEQYETLKINCARMVADQDEAIREVVESQKLRGKEPKETRIYSHELYSEIIYELEKIKASQENREPRLKPFDLFPAVSLWGIGFANPHTCKSQAIALLSTVLTQKQIDRITENGKHPTIPRFSGPMEDILLHSTGQLHKHTKASGAQVNFRDGKDPDVALHWTLPPQELEASPETINRFKIDEKYCSEIKSVVRKLQKLEWFIRNAAFPACESVSPEELEKYRGALLTQIIDQYKSFFNIEPKPEPIKDTSWFGYLSSFFAGPKSEIEVSTLQKLSQSKYLFNSLYMAMINGWQIHNDCPMEDHETAASIAHHEELQEDKEDVTEAHSNPLEALAAYLSVKDKQQLCTLLGRSYVEVEKALEDYPQNESSQAVSSQVAAFQ